MLFSLCLSLPLIGMQPANYPTKNMRALLQDNYAQFQKAVRCVWDKKSCTPQEIKDAQIYWQNIVDVLIVAGVGLTIVGVPLYLKLQSARNIQRIRAQHQRQTASLHGKIAETEAAIDTLKKEDKFKAADKAAQDLRKGKYVIAPNVYADLVEADTKHELHFRTPQQDKTIWQFLKSYRAIPDDQMYRTSFFDYP